jgi:hypothetical protein
MVVVEVMPLARPNQAHAHMAALAAHNTQHTTTGVVGPIPGEMVYHNILAKVGGVVVWLAGLTHLSCLDLRHWIALGADIYISIIRYDRAEAPRFVTWTTDMHPDTLTSAVN